MPIITVSMYTGKSQRDKDRLAEAITEDVVNILKVEKKDVIVVFRSISRSLPWKLVCFWNPSITVDSHI
jgi:4-oxalocrotonate tautomerase